MHFTQLETFCAVAKVNSFSKAAKLLHLSQPTISSHIQYLENHYNILLFNRSNQGVTLTEAGKIVYEYAQKILKIQDDMERHLAIMAEVENHMLTVGASSAVGNHLMPCSIWKFNETFANSKIKLIVANSQEILEHVYENNIELGLIDGPIRGSPSDIFVKEIIEDKMVIIAPAKEPWVDLDVISISELIKLPFIIRETGSGVRNNFKAVLDKLSLKFSDFQNTTEMGSMDAIKTAVELGLGLSVIPLKAVEKEVRRGVLTALELKEDKMVYYCKMIYKKQNSKSKIAKRFIHFLASPGTHSYC
ncbi:LysR family transcriptional regulator [Desulfitibacter alkalitolerans]|uniref:LysR family transcriptional regulator n=1 Tax=Desulfitibacter alkalitolerans TaxID=264641 RepID=UPI0004884C32|nr:LysR family transcriptional regulator [Desulfitibacter alkalitolerans]